MSSFFTPILLLIGSNIFMTYAWYGHLQDMKNRPLLYAIGASWLVALLEYCLQVPANRFGASIYTVPQLKVMQEIISMGVFALFFVIYMKGRLSWDFLWAGLCLVAAAWFMFRGVASAH